MEVAGRDYKKQARVIFFMLLVLVLGSCAPGVPEMPEIWQCQFNGTPRAFYCVNNKTKARIKIASDDPMMKAAQCISADDYKKSESWLKGLIELAKTRCQ